MDFALVALSVALVTTGTLLLFLVFSNRRHRKLFRPRGRAAVRHFDQVRPGIGKRKRGKAVCFVTGMGKAECACATCQGEES